MLFRSTFSLVLGWIFMAFAWSPALAAGPELNFKDHQLFVEKDGASQALPQDNFSVQPIVGTKMFFLALGEDDAGSQGLQAGLYIFENQGRPLAFAPTPEAEYCADVRLSPDGRILAMDAGTWLVRSWFFFSFPDLKPIGDCAYYQIPDHPDLIWVADRGVLVSTMDEAGHQRSCDYAPCGPVSVKYYAFETLKVKTLWLGTDLCDYTLTGLQDDGQTVTATELCLPSAKAWETVPDPAPTKKVTVKLP